MAGSQKKMATLLSRHVSVFLVIKWCYVISGSSKHLLKPLAPLWSLPTLFEYIELLAELFSVQLGKRSDSILRSNVVLVMSLQALKADLTESALDLANNVLNQVQNVVRTASRTM